MGGGEQRTIEKTPLLMCLLSGKEVVNENETLRYTCAGEEMKERKEWS